MSNKKWSRDEEIVLTKLYLKGSPVKDIYKKLKELSEKTNSTVFTERSKSAIRHKLKTLIKENVKELASAKSSIEVINRIEKIQKDSKYSSIFKETGVFSKETKLKKIVTMSDIHFPFAKESLLALILEQHSDADICVLNGDLLEGYSSSRYPKSKRISAIKEYRSCFEFVKLCASIFPEVHLIEGNHDVRTANMLKDIGLQKEQYDILRPNLLKRIANGEQISEDGELEAKIDMPNVFIENREPWYKKIGKTIFAHPWNKGGAKPGYSVEKVNNYFMNRYSYDEYDSVVIGHTHKIYKGVINAKLLIEQGCLSDLHMYGFSPRMQYSNQLASNGFAIIYQDENGNTDFNKSGPIYLGQALPLKK